MTAKRKHKEKNWFWRTIDSIEGDKVVWIIVLLLIMFSILAIFSSTSLLKEGSKDRIDFIKDHIFFVGIGLGLVFGIYKIPWLGLFRWLSQFGFLLSVFLLVLLLSKIDIEGVIVSEYINGARRTLRIFNQQFHVYEVVKVAMVMYLAWAIQAYKTDCEAMAKKKQSRCFKTANSLARLDRLAFLASGRSKRWMYMYIPILVITVMIIPGSNSSAIFIGAVMIAVLLIGDMPKSDILMIGAGLSVALLIMVGIYYGSGKQKARRIGTLISRVETAFDRKPPLEGLKPGTIEYDRAIDKMRQPYSAKIAIHEGGFLGKHSGNSTQKYVVSNIYGDYMYSFIIEEYGILGGIVILFLFVTLLARGSMIARNCSNEFAKITVGGLTILITGQAFMHMMVNVGLMPMTGQTLPLISHGSFAFLVFCIAFGVILSISRMAQKKIRAEEEAARPLYESDKDDIQVTMDVLEQL